MISSPTLKLCSPCRGLVDNALQQASVMPRQPRSPTGHAVALLPRLAPDFFGASSAAIPHGPRHGLVNRPPSQFAMVSSSVLSSRSSRRDVVCAQPQASLWSGTPRFRTGRFMALLPALSLWGLSDVILHGPCSAFIGTALQQASLRPRQSRSPNGCVVALLTALPWSPRPRLSQTRLVVNFSVVHCHRPR